MCFISSLNYFYKIYINNKHNIWEYSIAPVVFMKNLFVICVTIIFIIFICGYNYVSGLQKYSINKNHYY